MRYSVNEQIEYQLNKIAYHQQKIKYHEQRLRKLGYSPEGLNDDKTNYDDDNMPFQTNV